MVNHPCQCPSPLRRSDCPRLTLNYAGSGPFDQFVLKAAYFAQPSRRRRHKPLTVQKPRLDAAASDPNAPHFDFEVRHHSSLSNTFIISSRICLLLYLLEQPDAMLAAHCYCGRRDCPIPPQLDSSRTYASSSNGDTIDRRSGILS